jgi:DNA polymerase V
MQNKFYISYFSSVSAGFPSPADDYMDKSLNLNELLVEHPASTFFVRVEGDSMTGAGIYHGDILVIDKSLQAHSGDIIIAYYEGAFTVKRYICKDNRHFLYPEHPEYKPIEVTYCTDFRVWGLVKFAIHKV